MKRFGESMLLAVVIMSLSMLFSAVRDQVFAQNSLTGIAQNPMPVVVKAAPEPTGYIVDFVSFVDPNNQAKQMRAITVVDPVSKRICVYHEDLSEGTVKLCSVRRIQGDLQIEEFNPTKPTPRQVDEWSKKLRIQNQLEER